MKLRLFITVIFLFICNSGIVSAAVKSATHDLSTEKFEDRRMIPDGGDFTLMSSNGPSSLKQYKDKVVILLFGYLSCPDICQTMLKKIALTLKNIDQQDRNDVKVLFITLDPERDTLENLDKFVEYFDKNFLALTGEPQQIQHVANMYGVKYSKVKTADGKGYVINHSVANYILSPDNVIRYILPHDITADDMAHLIHNLFKNYYPPQ